MRISFLIVALLFGVCALPAEEPTPGKQSARTIELPAAVDFRKEVTDKENLDKTPGDQARMTKKFEFFTGPNALDATKKETMNYRLYLPSTYRNDDNHRFPLLIVLHGAGGSEYTPAPMRDKEKRKTWPFITISPTSKGWSPKQLLMLIDDLEKRYKIDADRIYLTGLSMGGSGTWFTAMAAPERFAAVAPLCGVAAISEAGRLIDLPVWAQVGANDSKVIVDFNKKMAEAMEKRGAKKFKLTVHPNVGHDVWSKVYDDPEFYRWLLEQQRSKSAAPKK